MLKYTLNFKFIGLIMKLICFSDTHLNSLPELLKGQEADLFIFAGDALSRGDWREWRQFYSDLKLVRKQCKDFVTVFGNHDFYVEENPQLVREELADIGIHLLMGEEVTIQGLRIYGEPHVPQFYDWAFMKSEEKLVYVYDQIPEGLDILVTHGPAYGILDKNARGEYCGSVSLKNKLFSMERPAKIHISGHLHESWGYFDSGKIKHYNVSILDDNYMWTNSVTEIEI